MWRIAEDDIIAKKMRKFRSDADVTKGYANALRDLAGSDDPSAAGVRKRGRLRHCYSYNVTKSHRVIYMVRWKERVIQIIDVDDHKNVFWRDNRA